MARPRVLVTRRIPTNGLERIETHAKLDLWDAATPITRDELLAKVPGSDGVVTMPTDRVDAEFLDAVGPQLRVISNFAVGYNNVDLSETHKRGIPVGNTPDVLTDATADVAVLLVLAAARRAKEATQQVRSGQWRTWEPTGLLGVDLVGRTLGIVGMGRIGAATAKRLVAGWGMRLLYSSRSPKPEIENGLGGKRVRFETLLAESDVVSVHTALTPDTERLIDGPALARMKPDAVLVNTSRGGVVDQDALHDALRQGVIRTAGLDVTTPEPLPKDHPLIGLPNCVILPHIGSATDDSRAAMAEIAADNVIAGIEGQPLRCQVPPPAQVPPPGS